MKYMYIHRTQAWHRDTKRFEVLPLVFGGGIGKYVQNQGVVIAIIGKCQVLSIHEQNAPIKISCNILVLYGAHKGKNNVNWYGSLSHPVVRQ